MGRPKKPKPEVIISCTRCGFRLDSPETIYLPSMVTKFMHARDGVTFRVETEAAIVTLKRRHRKKPRG